MKRMKVSLVSLCIAIFLCGCAPHAAANSGEQESAKGAAGDVSPENKTKGSAETAVLSTGEKETVQEIPENENLYPIPRYGITLIVPKGWSEFTPEERKKYYPDKDYETIFFNNDMGVRVYVEFTGRSLDLKLDELIPRLEEKMITTMEQVDPHYTASLGGREFQILDARYDSGKKDELEPGQDFYGNYRHIITMGGEEIMTVTVIYTDEAKANIDTTVGSLFQPCEETTEGRDSGHWEENTYVFNSAGMRVVIPEQMRIVSDQGMLGMGAGAQEYYNFVAVEDSEKPEDALRMRQVAVFALEDLGKSAKENLELVLPKIIYDNQDVSDITTMTVSGFEFATVTAQKEINGRLLDKLYLLHASNGKVINIIYTYNTLSRQEILDSLPGLIAGK